MDKARGPLFWTFWVIATAAFVFSPTLPIAFIGLTSGTVFGAVTGLASLTCAGLLVFSAVLGAKRLYSNAYVAVVAAALCVACAYVAASQLK